MKKSLLILFLSFQFLFTFGQICKTGNEWNYLRIMIPTCSYDVNCSGVYYEVDRYKIGGDSVINGKTYKKVLLSVENLAGKGDFYPVQFLREDINSKKVYLLYNDYDQLYDILLYDFTLRKDSTFKLVRPYSYFENHVKYTFMDTYYQTKVVQTDSVMCNGSKRLRIQFNDVSSLFFTDKYITENFSWIEGIGSLQDLTDYRYSWSQILLCFKQDSTLTYLNSSGLDCEFKIIDKITTPVINKFTVSVSPLAKGSIFINSVNKDELINQLIIYNLQGTAVINKQPVTSSCVVNNLMPGLYIMYINNTIQKLVVQ